MKLIVSRSPKEKKTVLPTFSYLLEWENIFWGVTSDPEGDVENVFCKNCSIIVDANKTALLYHQYSLEHKKSLALSKKKLSEKRELKKK